MQSKSAQIQELAEDSAQDAWKKALQEATPSLDKLPEIKQALNDNAGKFVAAGAAMISGSSNAAQEVFQKLKEAAESGAAGNKEKVHELREFVLKKAEEAEEAEKEDTGGTQKGWDILQGWIRTVPDGEEVSRVISTLRKS